jgi:tetratricopeptide (TPR) repeat protein
LAAAHTRRGALVEAFAAALRAKEIFARAHGSDHHGTAEALRRLAAIALRRGQTGEAERNAEAAQAIYERRFGARDARVGATLALRGERRLEGGRAAEALPLLERAVSVLGASPRPEPLAGARFLLARALVAAKGDAPRARALAAEARDAYARLEGYRGAAKKVEAWLASRRP